MEIIYDGFVNMPPEFFLPTSILVKKSIIDDSPRTTWATGATRHKRQKDGKTVFF